MNIAIPADAGLQIASTSASFISDIYPIATLIMGVLFAFFIIDSIIIGLINKRENEKN